MIIAVMVIFAAMIFPVFLGAGGSERIEKKSFDMEKGKRIDIDINVGGDIFITGWDGEKVEVEVVVTGRDRDDIEIDFKERSSVLKVEIGRDGWFRNTKADAKVIVNVPDRFDISFKTMGGDVEISGVEGETRGHTMGGDIDLSRMAGEADVKTMGGDITVSESVLDGVVRTMGGDVRIVDVKGDLKGSTMGGDVTYDGVKRRERAGAKRDGKADGDEKDVSVSTFGGDLDLDYEGKDVRARTFGGDVNVDNARSVKVSTMGGDIEVAQAPEGADAHTMGGNITIESAGRFARAKTMGGDIDIFEVDGRVKATTMGGDVKVRVVGGGEGDRDVELKSMGGDVELTVPKGYPMDFDIEITYTKGHRRDCGIVSDFPMTVSESDEWKSKWGQKRKYITGTGEVNGGGNRIMIRTVNGKVFVKEE
jgi:DUF4097 and DUF4098 domain-containing protein YvlB